MRNKKLISMLMLSAGFVACTQDEIVENGFAGIENQKDLVEDVVLNVSLGENVLTRAEYAGDKDGNVFQQFYLEPAWSDESWALTDNSALAGDQIGYVLANGANAIANYPFYLAGYGSAVAAPTKDVPNPTQKVWGLAAQDNYFYNLNWTGDFEVATKAGIEASVTAVKALQKKDGEYPALAVSALDVRKGIVRTHAGIMSGDYIAYYPYNAAFTEPGAVPAVGKMPLVSMYDAGELQTDRVVALERVNFYDRLFAIARETNEVSGANKSGDVSIVPMTSALTIQFTNEDTEKASATIKRITLRAATEGVKPFILKGRVALDNLNVVTPESVEGATTDLIGASFTEFSLEKATKEGDKVVPAKGGLLTIPYMADPSVKDYIVEIYTTDGLIATKTVQPGLGLGVADFITIDLSTWTFVPGTRKVFNETDFLAEVKSGGDIQLMDNIRVGTAFTMNENARPLVFTGDKTLQLYNGTINQPITMNAGHLFLGDDVVSAKKITAKHITLQTPNAGKGITGDIEADRLDLQLNATLTQYLDVKELTVNQNNPKSVTLKWADIETMHIGRGNTVTVDKDVKTGEGAYTHTVTVGEINNTGTLNVANLTVTTLNNNANVNVTGSLNATTINNDGNVYNTVFTPAGFTVTGETNAATFNNVNAKSVLTWNSANKDMNLKVTNAGIITVSAVKDFTGTVTNTGTVNLNEACNFKGTLDNNNTVNIAAAIEGVAGAINNNAGTITVGNAAYLGLTTTKLNVNAGRVIVDGGDINGNNQITIEEGAEFVVTAATENTLDDALSSKSYNAKLTGIIVSATEWPANVTATAKKIYLRGDMVFPGATALNGGLEIEGTSKVTSTEGKLTVSAITINKNHSLTFAENSNVDVIGNITNNGTYDQESGAVVWCAGITTGTGATWVKKPKY